MMWKILLLAAIFACDAVDFKCKRGCEAEYRDILRKYKSKYDDIDMKKVEKMAMKYKTTECFPTCGVFYYVNEDEFEVAEPADEFSEEELNDSLESALRRRNHRGWGKRWYEDSESELRKKKVSVFNCGTKERWSTEKKDWCCANMDLGCSEACRTKTKERWSDKKKDWCCANMKLGCRKAEEKKVSGFNCYTRDRWSDERRDWCCANKNLGCPKVKKPAFNCRTKDRWSTEKKAWCWSKKRSMVGKKTRKKTEESESDWGNGSDDKYCYKYSKRTDPWSRQRVSWELKKVKC